MSLLYLSDILRHTELKLNRVKLIRHVLSDQDFKKCYDYGFIKEYTQIQRIGFSPNYDYWVTFISDRGTSCKLYACYKVNGWKPNTADLVPAGFPFPSWFNGAGAYFNLEATTSLQDFEGRLIIDWGKATHSWHQKAIQEKTVLAIQSSQKTQFSGVEDLILDYATLKEIVEDPIVYSNWHTALSSIYAIYIITDTFTGKQYIGSAYGEGGLLSRWSYYIFTRHGGNKGIQDVLRQYPDRYWHFQFSILQVIPKTITDEDVIHYEKLYKDKLLTREFGMNEN